QHRLEHGDETARYSTRGARDVLTIFGSHRRDATALSDRQEKYEHEASKAISIARRRRHRENNWQRPESPGNRNRFMFFQLFSLWPACDASRRRPPAQDPWRRCVSAVDAEISLGGLGEILFEKNPPGLLSSCKRDS